MHRLGLRCNEALVFLPHCFHLMAALRVVIDMDKARGSPRIHTALLITQLAFQLKGLMLHTAPRAGAAGAGRAEHVAQPGGGWLNGGDGIPRHFEWGCQTSSRESNASGGRAIEPATHVVGIRAAHEQPKYPRSRLWVRPEKVTIANTERVGLGLLACGIRWKFCNSKNS